MTITSCTGRVAYFATVIATVVGLAVSANAQTVLVDFGSDASFRGLSVLNPDANNHYWNSFAPGQFFVDMVDINNDATTIDFGLSTPAGTDSYNGPAGPTGPDDDKALLRLFDLPNTDIDPVALGNLGGALEGPFDYITSPDPPDPVTGRSVRFEIQQLDQNKTYNLTFFGSHSFSIDNTTVYSVYTDNTYSTLVDSVSLDVQDPLFTFLHNRDMVATISGLSPQASDILYVEFVGSGGEFGYLNAMQIEAVASIVTGDFNDDGQWDCTDINLLTEAVAAGLNDPAFDMNGDGVVDGISSPTDVDNDLVAWLARAGTEDTQGVTTGNPFVVGDANLDGVNDGLDFIQWNNGKFTQNTQWCGNDDVSMIGGNFNGDNVIDGLDFILWNAFKFTSSGDVSAVPEPASGSIFIGLLGLMMGATARMRGSR